MRLRRIVFALLLVGLAWPVAARSIECACRPLKPAAHACCPASKPAPADHGRKKDCCSMAPEDRSRGEAVETVRLVPGSGPGSVTPPALQPQVALAQRPLAALGLDGGDSPGEPPPIHLSNCTFRI